jgi:hypothetical protein
MKKVIAEAKEQNGRPKAKPPVNVSLKTPEERQQALVQIAPPQNFRVDVSVPKMAMITTSMECDNCYVQDRCKYYGESKTCYFADDNTFENGRDLMRAQRFLLVAQYNRLCHALYQERLDGGVLDRNLSFEVERMQNMLFGFADFLRPQEEEAEIKVKGPGAVSAILAALAPRKRAVKPPVIVEQAQ